jgi:hypothetical protein
MGSKDIDWMFFTLPPTINYYRYVGRYGRVPFIMDKLRAVISAASLGMSMIPGSKPGYKVEIIKIF